MTLIEGVGDEVIQFVGAVLVTGVAALAWWSTNARPDRYRTVLVMRSRTRPVTVSIRTRVAAPAGVTAPTNLMLTNSQSTSNALATSGTASTDSATQSTITEPIGASVSTSTIVEESPREAGVVPLQEMDSIIDADMAMLDNNRLHFYRRVDCNSPNNTPGLVESGSDSETTEDVEVEPAGSRQIREMNSIVSAMEGDEPTGILASTETQTERQPNENASSSVSSVGTPEVENRNIEQLPGRDTVDGNKILIKLKYLNDTLKEVEGCLDEQLKDFKTRHFSTELSSECRVRLIFNGRVLVDDCATLQACGLHHRAVVHCLVHPKRIVQPTSGGSSGTEVNGGAIPAQAAPERAWDLENILMTLVSVALTVVWFFRCEYSNMFTASASVALFGLTVFYSVAIFGLYLSDTFHFDRRPPQPVPNN